MASTHGIRVPMCIWSPGNEVFQVSNCTSIATIMIKYTQRINCHTNKLSAVTTKQFIASRLQFACNGSNKCMIKLHNTAQNTSDSF